MQGLPLSYRMTFGTEERVFTRAHQAVRGMAREIKNLDMTDDELRAWKRWYTNENFRAAIIRLHQGKVFEFGARCAGETVVFRITPPTRANSRF